jgi:hypothetical protein
MDGDGAENLTGSKDLPLGLENWRFLSEDCKPFLINNYFNTIYLNSLCPILLKGLSTHNSIKYANTNVKETVARNTIDTHALLVSF